MTTTTIRTRRTPRARPGALFALVALALTAACGGSDDQGAAGGDVTGPTIPADAEAIVEASAAAMGEVESVAFELRRTGAPVYIDSFESIALDTANGQFTVPRSARAVIEVEVDGSLNTELGAIALDDEIWLSNPVTGEFETLPPGYDIDPSLFFDPQNGWRPLMANLTEVRLVGDGDDGDAGERYHVVGTAPAEQVTTITARLVRDQDVEIDFWIHPVTALVSRAEFSTDASGSDESIDWDLRLSDYGADFDISPPENLVDDG